METKSYYETIFKRKSIRKFELSTLEENTFNKVVDKLNNLRRLDSDIKTEFKIISEKEVKGLFGVKAPYYIVAYSEAKDGYLTNMGFMLQQIDLYLSSVGLGCCYQGMAKPKKEVQLNSSLEFVIVLAFGKPGEKLHRESINEFKRKSLENITNIQNEKELLEPARLAPSGVNVQPWYFTGDRSMIHVYCEKSKLLTGFMFDKINKINMGIVVCHLWLSIQNLGKEAEFIIDDVGKDSTPEGYYYVDSIKVK